MATPIFQRTFIYTTSFLFGMKCCTCFCCGLFKDNAPRAQLGVPLHFLQTHLVKQLRSRHSVYVGFMQKQGSAMLFPPSGAPKHHIVALHGLVNTEILHTRLLDEVQKIMNSFRNSWSSDAEALAGQLETSCPDWGPVRETLMDNDVMVTAMCDNKAYGTLAIVVGEIKKQLKLIKVVHDDRRGVMIDIAIINRCQRASDLAVETVAFTFFLYHATREWKKINNVLLAAKAVQSLRINLKPSGVKLTDQMEKFLDKFEAGELLGDAPPALPVPSAGVPRLVGGAAAVSGMASSSVAASGLANVASSEASSKRKLADKLKQAKRKC